MLRRALPLAGLLALDACARTDTALPPPVAEHPEAESAPAVPDEPEPGAEPFEWRSETRSPWPSDAAGERELSALCDARDGALDAAALRLAERALAGLPPLEPTDIHYVLRTEGAPYVWARAWSLDGAKLSSDDVQLRVERWLAKSPSTGQRRCGFARRTVDGRDVAYALAVDALAELEPVPTRARAGQWLRVRAKLLVPSSEAKLVVLGPSGLPRPVPTSLSGGVARATFSADRAGTWMLQLVATVDGGPRPVAEALVHVDVAPPRGLHARPAPGEDASSGAAGDAGALLAMVNAARRAEKLAPLARDPRLDRVAEEHAAAMQSARRLGHDVGGGSAADRMRALGLEFRGAGENVARAASIQRAHRALWASPSHRGNVLDPRFTSVGVGVAKDPDGSVWACEVFAAWH